jgi:hypothetical protein
MQKRSDDIDMEAKEHLKQNLPLTDWCVISRRQEEMITKLQVKCGKTRQKLHKY